MIYVKKMNDDDYVMLMNEGDFTLLKAFYEQMALTASESEYDEEDKKMANDYATACYNSFVDAEKDGGKCQ